MYNYPLKYRTFDQLLSDVHVDFQNLSLESMIEPQQLIKVVKRVNYDLGLRINKTKEVLLDVEKGRVKLPDDFYVLNYALVCDEVSVNQSMPQGTWTEERPLITPYKMTTPGVISTCNDGTVNCCGTCTQPLGTCGCSVPTCGQCVQPIGTCGCSIPAPSCGCGTAPCGCNILEKLPDPCNSSSTIVNTTDTVSTTTRQCCYNSVLLLQGTSLSFLINSTPFAIPLGTASQMQTSLNALGLGAWVVTPDSLPLRFTFCVDGVALYGVLTTVLNSIPRVTDPTCTSDTTIIATNTSIETCLCGPGCEVITETSTSSATASEVVQNCCWSGRFIDGTTSITIVINGTTYTIPYPALPTAMVAYLDSLNLGTWTLTVDIANRFVFCVTGTVAVYGALTIIRPQAPIIVQPACDVDTTTSIVNNVITTCKCQKITPGPIPVPPVTCTPTTDACVKPRVILNCKNECYELVQIINPGVTRTYKRLLPIKILENPQSVDCGCPNLYMNCSAVAWIREGWLYTNLDCAVVYISYQGQMEDEDGNLLCPDHDEINEYYEYAVKQRILENLMMNDEPVGRKLELVELRLRAARNYALTIVNTPNFSEMKRVFNANRKAQYSRYYDMFRSYGPVPAVVPNNFNR